MKKSLLTVLLLLCALYMSAQSNDFEQVYEACILAQKSMSHGMGSHNEIKSAAGILNSASWSRLILYNMSGTGEAEFEKKTMVFTPEYLLDFCEDRKKVYDMARQYAVELLDEKRGDEKKVKLCTKCIAAGSKVTYGMRHYGSVLNVAAVAEVNGLINLYVELSDESGNRSLVYKSTSNEFKGMPSRMLKEIPMPKGLCDVYITIENKYAKPRSVAIIVE